MPVRFKASNANNDTERSGQWNVLKINLARAKAAHDLLRHEVLARGLDLCIVSEPTPKKEASEVQVFHCKKKDAAVWVRRGVTVERVDTDWAPGLALVRVAGGPTFVSVYHSPNAPREQHERQLAELVEIVDRAVARGEEVVVAGDFNAKSAMWGSLVEDERGRRLGEAVIGLGLVTCSVGSVPTFVRGVDRTGR